MAKRRGASAPKHVAKPKTAAPVPVQPLAAAIAGAVAFWLVTGLQDTPVMAESVWLRALAAGVAVGLLHRGRSWQNAALVALCGAFVSAVGLVFVHATARPLVLVLAMGVLGAGIVAAAVAAFVPRDSRWGAPAVAAALLAIACAWSLGFMGGPLGRQVPPARAQASTVSVPEDYSFDTNIFGRTIEYMREGQPYYPAFQQAWSEDSRLDGPIPSAFNFREPLLFYLWAWTPIEPGLRVMFETFFALGIAVTFAAWYLARDFVDDGVAILAGLLILPTYSLTVLTGGWFGMIELWGALPLVLALALLFRRKLPASVLLLTLAVAIRELNIIFVPVWLVSWWFSGRSREQWWLPVAAVVGPIAVVGAHVALAPATGSSTAVSAWLNAGGPMRTWIALGFMSGLPLATVTLPLAAIPAVAGSALVRDSARRWAALCAVTVPLVFLSIFGSGVDHYWGFVVQPVVAAFAPLAFVRVFPRT